ncbi:hypothetical protein [Nocardioides piscis]|uniref:Mce-associated membrane protein n=1 Tax=Nocardioides piscis TaxID=2714938 RepID=A0A6G7YCD9_9ACTN|nr:hypothetical protein [Nocardioides piscis]QIK74430.1 hypothetical protein G7071_02225 [Nocardioides piscis]
MVVPPAPADPGLTTPPTTDTPARPLFRLVLAVVLLAVILAATATAAYVWSARPSTEGGETQAAREDVMSQTEQFMLRMGTYGPDLLDEANAMPEYRERVKEVITPKFAASFDEQAGAAEQLVAQAGVARVPDVFSTGVASIDADSASTLVAGSFSDSYTVKGKKIEQEPIPFRLQVKLVKVDGEWLVDDFDPVSSDGSAPEPGLPAPSEPTDQGSGQ